MLANNTLHISFRMQFAPADLVESLEPDQQHQHLQDSGPVMEDSYNALEGLTRPLRPYTLPSLRVDRNPKTVITIPEEEEAESQASGRRSSWPTRVTDILPRPSGFNMAPSGPYLGHLERHHF